MNRAFILFPLHLTLASAASVVGAACAVAQGVTDAIVGYKRLLGIRRNEVVWQIDHANTET
jgi:hypothetical protein